jgi:hypothetical protein
MEEEGNKENKTERRQRDRNVYSCHPDVQRRQKVKVRRSTEDNEGKTT